MLGFETQCGMFPIDMPVLARGCSVEEISGIELDPGLGCFDNQHAPSLRVQHTGSFVERLTVAAAVQDEIFVIAFCEMELFIVLVDSFADGRWRTEIKRAVYVAIGITLAGMKEVLGLWTSANEGAKFWLGVLTEMRWPYRWRTTSWTWCPAAYFFIT